MPADSSNITAVLREAQVQLICEELHRVECIAYDRIKFGSDSQGTVVPKLYAKGRVKTSPERAYAPHAILLEYIDGVSLTHFMEDPEDTYELEDNDTIYHDADTLKSSLKSGQALQNNTNSNKDMNEELSRTLPKGITMNVYSSCASKEEKRKKKVAIEESLRMLAKEMNRWMELGVANDDLFPRNMIYVDNPRPGQCHFRVIDFNTCIIAPLSATALAHEKTLMTSQKVWVDDAEDEHFATKKEMDGFEVYETVDDLPAHRFLKMQMSKVWWKTTYRELKNFRTWMLINFITELPFLRWRPLQHKPWSSYFGIFADFLPPVWRYLNDEEEEERKRDEPLSSIRQNIEEIKSLPEAPVV